MMDKNIVTPRMKLLNKAEVLDKYIHDTLRDIIKNLKNGGLEDGLLTLVSLEQCLVNSHSKVISIKTIIQNKTKKTNGESSW